VDWLSTLSEKASGRYAKAFISRKNPEVPILVILTSKERRSSERKIKFLVKVLKNNKKR